MGLDPLAGRGLRVKKPPYAGIDVPALQRALGVRPVQYLLDRAGGGRGSRAEVLRTGKAGVNEGAVWALLANKLYGSSVDAPAIATREALQNSRDAIDSVYRKRLLDREAGRFEVHHGSESGGLWIRWADNGVGMDPDTVFQRFLFLGESDPEKRKGGLSAGGFGIAKAIILGISQTFRWELRTRGYLYRAHGFDQPVEMLADPDPLNVGTELTIHDVNPEFAWYGGSLQDRLLAILGANNLQPRGRHAGVRLYLQGHEVTPLMRGGGTLLARDLPAGPQTSMDVRAYPARTGEATTFVRLDGLLQFHQRVYSVPLHVVFDLDTTLAPSDAGYPLSASRTQLSGHASNVFYDVLNRLEKNAVSATREKTQYQTFYAGTEEARAQEAALLASIARYQSLLADPKMRAHVEQVAGGGVVYRALARSLEVEQERYEALRRAPRQAVQEAEVDWWRPGEDAPGPPRPDPQQPGPPRPPRKTRAAPGEWSEQALRKLAPKQPKQKQRTGTNPWAGVAGLRINVKDYDARRLRRYLANPRPWFDAALVWRFTIQMVLDQLDRPVPFDVGFIFDGPTRAMYSRDADNGRETIWVSPEWYELVWKTYRDQPFALASTLHAKACHEVAHLLGEHDHDEGFSSLRERVQDETVGLLYPLAAMVSSLLHLPARRGGGGGGSGARAFRAEPGHVGCGICRRGRR